MTDYPSLPEQGKNLAQFTFEVVKQAFTSNSVFVSSEIKQQRLDTCKQCEYYDSRQIRCKHCGCFLEYKTNFALDSCPIDKWSVEMIEEKKSDDLSFPPNPKVGDIYCWKDRSWTWTGELWDFMPVQEESTDTAKDS
jgi:hypothetical protein